MTMLIVHFISDFEVHENMLKMKQKNEKSKPWEKETERIV